MILSIVVAVVVGVVASIIGVAAYGAGYRRGLADGHGVGIQAGKIEKFITSKWNERSIGKN